MLVKQEGKCAVYFARNDTEGSAFTDQWNSLNSVRRYIQSKLVRPSASRSSINVKDMSGDN